VVAFSINKSDGVTAVSESLRQQTYDFFPITQDIEVIYNFIDLDRFKRINKDHFKKAIAPNGERILIHVSNFRKVKRSEDVIKVFKRISERIPSKLLLIGDGPERSNLEALCREFNLCDEIRFLGKQDAIEEILSISDLFLMPSASESFGLAALEAMACEVPVISTNVGGLPELNIHGKTGFLDDVGDVEGMAAHGIQILSSDETLQKFRDEALAQAQRFDIKAIVPQYEAYYRKVLDRSLHAPVPE
jgi:N-acetyl-alpha-D-glucosaminyl L-malate synthase BshA